MRRVVLLGLLALALPTAALASSVDYVGQALTTGTPASVAANFTAGGNVTVTLFSLSINGGAFAAGTIKISANLSTSCGANCFDIGGGTVQIWNSSNALIYSGTFTNGTVLDDGGSITLGGRTTGGNTVAGVFKVGSKGWFGSSDTFVTPEPGTLGLLGTGLVGLAGLVRRRMRS